MLLITVTPALRLLRAVEHASMARGASAFESIQCLQGETPESLARMMRQLGRAGFLSEIAQRGLSKKEERWALADDLARALHSGLAAGAGDS